MVIVAGYAEEMDAFLNVNQGLASRLSHEVVFEDYSDDELADIFAHILEQRHLILEDGGMDAVKTLIADKRKNICVVGDDDQSIYKFRGATIENILSFETTFPGAKVIRLEQNYRSTQHILEAANKVIRHNEGRKGKNLWTAAQGGDKVYLNKVANEYEESLFVADKVLDMVAKGEAQYKDFAVLYRTNAQSNAIERSFVKSGIAYKVIGGVRFYDRKEIRDILSYLFLIQNHIYPIQSIECMYYYNT